MVSVSSHNMAATYFFGASLTLQFTSHVQIYELLSEFGLNSPVFCLWNFLKQQMKKQISSIKVGLFHFSATTKCPQQQRKKASFLTQREGEERGEEVREQPWWWRDQREPGGSAKPTGRHAQRWRVQGGTGRQDRCPEETRRWGWGVFPFKWFKYVK